MSVTIEQQKQAYSTIMSFDPYGPQGCFVEVDLLYPYDLHNYHNDFPLAAESSMRG